MITKPELERVAAVNNEASLKEVVTNLRNTMLYLKSKWLWILIVAVIGGVGGYLYSKAQKPVYTAEATFVLDESSGSKGSGGQLSALGLGIDGASGDFFSATDNIIWLYSTRLMVQKALLTAVDTSGKKVLLIDWFLKESGLNKAYAKKPAMSKIRFTEQMTDTSLTPMHNSIISTCAAMIKGSYLKAEPTPKTENVISVRVQSKDELFAKTFTNVIVATVNEYYIQTKTRKAKEEVMLLEEKTGQYKSEMSSDMYQVATSTDDAPYANPNRTILRVAPQRKQVDAKISADIYSGLVQQLEMSKTNLQKQTPLIQVIEEPVLPLGASGKDPKKYSLIGFFVFAILTAGVFLAKYQFKKMML